MIVLALNAALINRADNIPSTSSLCDRHAVIDIFWFHTKIPKFIVFETTTFGLFPIMRGINNSVIKSGAWEWGS